MKTLKAIAEKYFQDNPEAKDEVLKAYYAYHSEHFRCDQKAHYFAGPFRDSSCHWCGRTREQVRWDDLPAACTNRPKLEEIEVVVLNEEQTAHKLFARAEKEVPKLLQKFGLTGETLAKLHHTYGYDIETVCSIVDVPAPMLLTYEAAMNSERAKSISSLRKVMVIAATQ